MGRKLCTAFSCSLRKYFSTAWRMISDSLAASASVSMRNQVLPADAWQTYLMLPPGQPSPVTTGSRPGMRQQEAKAGRSPESTPCAAIAATCADNAASPRNFHCNLQDEAAAA